MCMCKKGMYRWLCSVRVCLFNPHLPPAVSLAPCCPFRLPWSNRLPAHDTYLVPYQPLILSAISTNRLMTSPHRLGAGAPPTCGRGAVTTGPFRPLGAGTGVAAPEPPLTFSMEPYVCGPPCPPDPRKKLRSALACAPDTPVSGMVDWAWFRDARYSCPRIVR